jgi:diketogulonate reductase-like aldo/keto reductase
LIRHPNSPIAKYLSYGNQPEIGEALKKSFAEIPGLKREDVFIVSLQPLYQLIQQNANKSTDLQALELVSASNM